MPANKILSLYETYVPLTIFQSYGTITNSDYVTFFSLCGPQKTKVVSQDVLLAGSKVVLPVSVFFFVLFLWF